MLLHPYISARSRVPIIVLAWLLAALIPSPGLPTQAQVPPAQQCYVVADTGNALWEIDPVTGASSRVGSLGGSFNNVEAIALNLDATILYATNDDGVNGQWGTINMGTGAFSFIGSIGPGSGVDPATGLATTDPLAAVDSRSSLPAQH
jgi:hypothetical protein